jgi:hypothetical protein
MTDHETERDIETDATLAAHGFLIEQLFLLIFDLDPRGKEEAFRATAAKLRDLLSRRAADEFPTTAKDVLRSNAAEQMLNVVLARLSHRFHAP